MEHTLVPFFGIFAVFIGLPWLIFHYVTQWKRSGGLTQEDEKALDEMYETARRLDERLATIERIIAADAPDYRLGRARELLDTPAPIAPMPRPTAPLPERDPVSRQPIV